MTDWIKALLPVLSLLLSLLLLLGGCSTPPKPQYQVNTYRQISYQLMALADRKRQLGLYPEALELYSQVEDYAGRRHDTTAIGTARLKRAAIYIAMGQFDKAQLLMDEVGEMVEFDDPKLAEPLKFIQVKLALATDRPAQAQQWLTELAQAYQQQPQKQLYYRLYRWHYFPKTLDYQQVQQDLATLEALKQSAKLDNIEIYSFALMAHAQWLASNNKAEFEAVFKQAVAHFSSLELISQIKALYLLASDHYQRNGQPDKAEYFRKQWQRNPP